MLEERGTNVQRGRERSQGVRSKPGDVCSNASQNVQNKSQINRTRKKPLIYHQSRCRHMRMKPGWGPHPSLLRARIDCGRAGKIRTWHQRLRATSLAWAAEGPRAERCSLGPSSSTDGGVHVKYSTGGRQVGASQEGLEPGI